VVFRNHHGHILVIGAGPLGHSTNNAAELWGLIKGLQLAIKNNYTKIIVEGDSQVIIGLLRRILHGANPDSISPSWRLSHGLQIIAGLLHPHQVIIPTHIRRKANQVADELANLGTNWRGPDLQCYSAQNPDHPILQQCIRKAGLVDVSPDGVLVRSSWQGTGAGTSHAARSHVMGSCHRPPPSLVFNCHYYAAREHLRNPLLPLNDFEWLGSLCLLSSPFVVCRAPPFAA
jgi:ribonuclease HI